MATTVRVPVVRFVDIDGCMVDTVTRLTELGIATTGSCCGHGVGPTSVTVTPSAARFAEAISPEKRLREMPLR